jgi:hypothetical protein
MKIAHKNDQWHRAWEAACDLDSDQRRLLIEQLRDQKREEQRHEANNAFADVADHLQKWAEKGIESTHGGKVIQPAHGYHGFAGEIEMRLYRAFSQYCNEQMGCLDNEEVVDSLHAKLDEIRLAYMEGT